MKGGGGISRSVLRVAVVFLLICSHSYGWQSQSSLQFCPWCPLSSEHCEEAFLVCEHHLAGSLWFFVFLSGMVCISFYLDGLPETTNRSFKTFQGEKKKKSSQLMILAQST